MTYLSNRLETARKGYMRQQVIADGIRREVNEWKTKYTLATSEAKLNRDGQKLAEKATAEARNQLEAMTVAKDDLEMHRAEDSQTLSESVALIDHLAAERNAAVIERDSFREEMRHQRDEHSRHQNSLMA